jgi:hypothetical protein
LENYEGYVKLAERIYRMQDGAKVPSGFGAEPQNEEETLRRVEDRLQRTTARLDITERSTTRAGDRRPHLSPRRHRLQPRGAREKREH